MNWYKSSQKLFGYKIVGWDGQRAFSLMNTSITYAIEPGTVHANLYLGTSPEFVKNYYTGLTDFADMLLEYSFDPADIVQGGGKDSEVFVKKATLIRSEIIK